MFRLPRALDVVTLFHNSQYPSSVRALNLLTQLAANSRGQPTSGSTFQSRKLEHRKSEFELNVTEDHPTDSQLQTIFEYALKRNIPISTLVERAMNPEEAFKILSKEPRKLNKPLIVDWMRGNAFVGHDEKEIIAMIDSDQD